MLHVVKTREVCFDKRNTCDEVPVNSNVLVLLRVFKVKALVRVPVYSKMDQPIVCKSSVRLLLFMLTCVCVFCGPTKQNHQEIESKLLKSTRLHQERFRRDLYGLNEVTKCSDSRQCFGNKTTFYTRPEGCYCDEACYKIFSDCCPDYEKQCGRQELPKHKTSLWQCVELDFESWGYYIEGTTGVWMISKCLANWPSDKLRTKCENVPSKFSYPLEDYIPVVAAKGETYRNKHCALCNGVKNYTAWDFKVSTYIIPPAEFDLKSKLKFIVENGGSVVIKPKPNQPRRFCFGRNLIDNCGSLPDDKACVEGPVEVVVVDEFASLYFKNSACATCNGFHNVSSFIFTKIQAGGMAVPFSIVFDLKTKASGILKIISRCPTRTVYDPFLKFCRDSWYFVPPTEKPTNDKLTNKFVIYLWFQQFGGGTFKNNNLRFALITQFWLRDDQISKMTFHLQDKGKGLFVAEFHLTLTPFQSLITANQQNGNFNLTRENTAFLELLNFTKPFTLSWQRNSFFVRQVLSKRLSCYDEINLQSDEYRIDENGSFVVSKTGKTLSLEDYTLVEGKEGRNIRLCRKLVLSDCNDGAYVPLSTTEYVVYPNLTVYHNATKSLFNFGEYLLSENTGTSRMSNTSQNSLFSNNSTISICLRFKDRFKDCNDGAYVPLSPTEYVVFPNLTVYHNATKSLFNFGEYLLSGNNGTSSISNTSQNSLVSSNLTISICLRFKDRFKDCNDGAYVPLSPTEYVVFPNLTVYHKATKSFFNFGEYLLNENNGTRSISNTSQNSLFSSNSTISICLPFKDRFNRTEKIYVRNTTSYALRILTVIGFSVSIICLILLLITYGLFQELRTVPGMNLMNLSFSMLLSHLLWLIGSSHFTGTTACKVFAILEHYLFQVSFLAMSVVSYHSCYVFSQPFAGRVANKSLRRFIKYSAFVWLAPAIFVAICVTMDKTGAFLVDYGINCWLGNVDAKLYLFLLPLALLLVYNIFTFIRTAVSLYRHDRNTQVLQRKERKQNLLICTKLATLVGFPWLFAFIGIMFPDVEAFEYLFVVFACLQGLYIGMAFLFTKKTLNLYKDRWNIGSRRNAPSYTAAATFEMT